MMKIIAGDGSKFMINELDNDRYEIHRVEITDGCWGILPVITIYYKWDKPIVELNQELSGCMITFKGYKIKFKGYVYNINYLNNEGNCSIMCTDKDFIKKKFSTWYSNIDNAINSTWKRDRLDNLKSDIISLKEPWRLYQMNETNHNFCSRMCMSYLHNTIYAFRLDGLRFTNLSDWKPEVVLNHNAEAIPQSASSWVAPRQYGQELSSDNPNGSIIEFEGDPNHIYVRCDEGLIPVSSAYRDLIGNNLYNQRLEQSTQKSTWKLRYLSELQSGDMVKINSNISFNKCFIESRSITFDHTSVTELITVKSITP